VYQSLNVLFEFEGPEIIRLNFLEVTSRRSSLHAMIYMLHEVEK